MSTLSSTCPECGTTFMPKLIEAQPVGSENPDHTFVEVAEKFACAECGEQLAAQFGRQIHIFQRQGQL